MQQFDQKVIPRSPHDFTEINSTVPMVNVGLHQSIPRQNKLICSGNHFCDHATPQSEVLLQHLNTQRTEWIRRRFLQSLWFSFRQTELIAPSLTDDFSNKKTEIWSTLLQTVLSWVVRPSDWLWSCAPVSLGTGSWTVHVGWPRWAGGWNQISKMKRASESDFLKLTAI